jgi:hypothetical protein
LRNQAVYKVATSLANSRWVAKGLYDRAVEALGHVGITDVICVIATPRGRVRARARFNGTLGDGIVAAQHGWWQACPELGLPGYDPLDEAGANVNLAIGTETVDPVSGAAPHRCYPCDVEKLGALPLAD